MKNSFFRKILEKYEEETATQEETKVVETFFETMQENGIDSKEVERDLGLRNRIFDGIQTRILEKRRKKIYKTFVIASSVAASVLLFFSLNFFFNKDSNQKQDWIVLENNNQNPQSFVLPDKTIVWLSPKSTLAYSAEFGIKNRPTKLRGQAFFQVTKNPKQPFTITTGAIVTQVLGTSFNINQEETGVEVSVSTGLVKVSDNYKNFELKPNQKIVYSNNSKQFVQSETNAELQQLWWKGEILLNKVKVIELAQTLKELYQKEFVFVDKEAQNSCLYSLKLKKGESLDSLLARINYLNEVQLKTKKNMVEISVK